MNLDNLENHQTDSKTPMASKGKTNYGAKTGSLGVSIPTAELTDQVQPLTEEEADSAGGMLTSFGDRDVEMNHSPCPTQAKMASPPHVELDTTPEVSKDAINSECHVVGRKTKRVIDEEKSSQHSRWEHMRKQIKEGGETNECSFFLRMMELEDSDEEELVTEENQISLAEAGLASPDCDMGNLKKKNKWGPTLEVQRPRRFPDDGRTVTQKTMDYAKYVNLEVDHKPG
ncbi:hypothetical protein C2845_PM17G06560 [Panicum miliaceum]|uniref:Uncharacterized protein n=1 Tax=Panicum miliaceum TaxID=4540 RepID=A0A3L6Q466_PANMI|nr:hypothetical protein C2845_PM17G06560 [Panicum miliaceum]